MVKILVSTILIYYPIILNRLLIGKEVTCIHKRLNNIISHFSVKIK